MQNSNTGDAKDWIEKAEHDLQTAKVNIANERYDAAAFYSQQAAEKALKAVYIMQYKSLWKIHDLAGIRII